MSNMTHMTRRTALAAKAAAVTAAAAGLSTPANAATAPKAPDWRRGDAKAFSSLIGSTFIGLRENGEPVSLTLRRAESTDMGPALPRHFVRREAVSLVFDCDNAQRFLSHESVRVAHPALGKTTLFLGAEPRKSGGYRVTAIMA